MQSSVKRILLLAALTIGISSLPLFAQEYEVHPYAGGMWMSDYNSTLTFKTPGVWGLKGGAYLTDHVMLEGNAGWINQINFKGYSTRTGGVLYEGAVNYNFNQSWVHGAVPFVSFGMGGLTVKTRNGTVNNTNQALFVYPLAQPQYTTGPIPNTTGTLVMTDNDTFFNFSYGAGIKGQRLWGPLGLRADLRGRTITSFYGQNINAIEATAGLLFSWGER